MVRRSDPVEALIFDLGGVLIDIDFDRVFSCWARFSALSAAQIRNKFSMDAAYRRHERGQISAAKYFDSVRRQFHLDASDTQISDGWNEIFIGPIQRNLAAISELAGNRPKYIFSNTNQTHEAFFCSQYATALQGFDAVFVSSSLGCRKPERQAFEAVIRSTGHNVSQLLFFDDTHENVDAARGLGMRSVLVNRPDAVRDGLAGLTGGPTVATEPTTPTTPLSESTPTSVENLTDA